MNYEQWLNTKEGIDASTGDRSEFVRKAFEAGYNVADGDRNELATQARNTILTELNALIDAWGERPGGAAYASHLSQLRATVDRTFMILTS